MKRQAIQLLGWYGVLAIVAAYLLNSFSIVGSRSLPYQLLNLSGAVGIVIEAASKKDLQPAALNTIWSVIALIAIINIIR